jgi:DDE superfamily endonuclease
VRDLVEADLWSQLPTDVPHLLALLPRADLYLQDEVQFAFHPTLTRVWCLKGRRGQRLVEAPGDNRKVYGFGLVDWRDGWFDGRIASGRTADVFCEQVRAAVARSKERGHGAIIITDNLKTHTAQGSLLVREPGWLNSPISCLWSTRPPTTRMPIASSGSGASHAVSSHIIIIGATLRRGFLMPEHTLRRSRAPLTFCFVISAVLLRLTSDLIDPKHMPHNALQASQEERR